MNDDTYWIKLIKLSMNNRASVHCYQTAYLLYVFLGGSAGIVSGQLYHIYVHPPFW